MQTQLRSRQRLFQWLLPNHDYEQAHPRAYFLKLAHGHHIKTRNDKAPLGGDGRTTRRPSRGFRHEEVREAQQGL